MCGRHDVTLQTQSNKPSPRALKPQKLRAESTSALFKFYLFIVGIWVWSQSFLHLQSRCSKTWTIPSIHFALVILEMESHELFAQADLELQSSWSQPLKVARITGVSHWHLAKPLLFVSWLSQVFLLIVTENWLTHLLSLNATFTQSPSVHLASVCLSFLVSACGAF
jgi:hypothetical protein